jgi:hypothetical protein
MWNDVSPLRGSTWLNGFGSRGGALRSATRLPLAFKFRAFGAQAGDRYVSSLHTKNRHNDLLLLSVTALGQTQKRRFTQSQAIAFAERFIAQNGYRDLPPDKKQLSYETIELESNIDEMLRQRHDILERRANGFVRERKSGERGWTVVFRFKHPKKEEDRKLDRAVTMNLDGSNPRMEHVPFLLRYAKKL